jgi:uncharacterized coiled-coil DUF342 family protein
MIKIDLKQIEREIRENGQIIGTLTDRDITIDHLNNIIKAVNQIADYLNNEKQEVKDMLEEMKAIRDEINSNHLPKGVTGIINKIRS